MTLTTHSIIAAAVTKPLAHMNPFLIFAIALATHYASDAIPHWDYSVSSIDQKQDPEKRHWGNNRNMLLNDIVHFAIDGLLGAGIVLFAAQPSTPRQWTWVVLAIIGGSLPDFLQGIALFKISWLKPVQRFHDKWHTNIRLGPYPLLGIPLQVVIALGAILIIV